MKKLIASLAVVFSLGGVLYAGNQYNWGTSTGGAWVTPDDTATLRNQVLQIGGNSQVVVANSSVTIPGTLILNQSQGAGLGLTKAQLTALTPSTTGQIAWCSDCTNTLLVIATGTAVSGWAGVFQSSFSVSTLPSPLR